MQAATERRSDDDDRVPLDALIELTHAEGGEVLEADAVDVSSGGLSLRAAFMPPVGARMQCRFSCPPRGDRVTADCEVVWSVLEGPRAGAFGVRFLALDTRSATLIRHLLEPETAHVQEVLSAPAPDAARGPSAVASLHIDGLGAPIEADVRADEGDHVVLTQELDFLRLGRGVRVEIDGTERRRGRIASVQLEHVRSDTPALALGVLIDAPELASVARIERAAPQGREVPSEPEGPEERSATDTWPQSPLFVADPAMEAEAPGAAPVVPEARREKSSEPSAQATACVEASTSDDPSLSAQEPTEAAATVATAPMVSPPTESSAASAPQEAVTRGTRLADVTRVLPDLRSLASAQTVEKLREQVVTLLARGRTLVGERLPSLRDWLLEAWARLRAWAGSQAKRFEHFRRAQKKRRTTAPPPKARGKQVAGRRGQQRPASARPEGAGRGRLVLLGLLAFAGVAGAIYSLAPRHSDEALVLHRPVQQPPESARVAKPAQAQPAPVAEAVAAPAAEPAADEAPEVVSDGRSFGAASVPNGRTYSLRMSGPIESIEGETLPGGFSVSVPGRLSLDRAGPIATSHPALAKSLILNQGDRAELTIEFAPGKKPAYRVEAKGNNLEISVERL